MEPFLLATLQFDDDDAGGDEHDREWNDPKTDQVNIVNDIGNINRSYFETNSNTIDRGIVRDLSREGEAIRDHSTDNAQEDQDHDDHLRSGFREKDLRMHGSQDAVAFLNGQTRLQ